MAKSTPERAELNRKDSKDLKVSGKFRPSWPGIALLALLGIKLVLGWVYLTQQPLWQYHEADFLRVARIMRDAGRLPIPEDYPDGDMATRNANQPPLYYGLIYPVVAVLDDDQPAPPGFLPLANCEGYNANLTDILTTRANNPPPIGTVLVAYMLRSLSLLMGLAAAAFTYLAGRALFEGQPGIALGAAALVAFEPTLVELASEVNNDTLILMLGAAHLWLCARFIRGERGQLGAGVALLVVSVLAVLSKLTGWLLLVVSLALVTGVLGRRAWRGLSRRQIIIVGAATGLVGLVLAGFALYNLQQYGSILGRYQGLETTISQTLAGLSPGLAVEVAAAAVSDTLLQYQAPLRDLQPRAAFVTVYRLVLLIGLLAGAAVMFWHLHRGNRRAAGTLALLFVLFGLVAGLVIFRSILNNVGQTFVNQMILLAPVRYYAPGLPALALIFATGFSGLTPARLRRWNPAAVGLAGAYLLVAVLWIAIWVRANTWASQAVLTSEDFAALRDIIPVQASTDPTLPRLLGYRVVSQSDAGLLAVTFYLQADSPLNVNYAGRIDLVSGGQQQSCLFVPVRGMFPTPRWEPGQIIAAEVDVPNCVGVSFPAELRLQWIESRSNGRLVDLLPRGEPLSLGTVETPLKMAALCPLNLGQIAGLQIVAFHRPSPVQPGEVVTLSVNWLARRLPPEAFLRIYRLTHTAGIVTYTCASQPRQDTYPFARWTPGETVYFDDCPLLLPAGAPTGMYTLAVGVQDAAGRMLPAVDPAGNSLADGFIELGEITVGGAP